MQLRSVYDRTIRVVDIIESFREAPAGMRNVYLSIISNRMNAVMKVLTIIATISIPLASVVGIYGMNFRCVPELQWRWGTRLCCSSCRPLLSLCSST